MKSIELANENIAEMQEFAESKYQELFGDNFKDLHVLYRRMKSDVHPITDDELTSIITMLPLELFEVSNNLNKLKLEYEVLKIEYKSASASSKLQHMEVLSESSFNKTERAEMLSLYMTSDGEAYEALLAVYKTIIERVERESSFARELIMGAKKVYESRRSAEQDPVTTDDPLPVYQPPDDGKAYIK